MKLEPATDARRVFEILLAVEVMRSRLVEGTVNVMLYFASKLNRVGDFEVAKLLIELGLLFMGSQLKLKPLNVILLEIVFAKTAIKVLINTFS